MRTGGSPPPHSLGYFGVTFAGAEVGGSGGVSGVRLQAYARLNTTDRPHGVVNDYIASALGRAAGVPVPPGTLVAFGSDTYGYVSMGFSDRGDRPPPVVPSKLASERPWETTGIIAFDQWVMNNDRHTGNLPYMPKLGVAAYDHDLALVGRTNPESTVRTLRSVQDDEIKAHSLAPHLADTSYIQSWCDRIAAITAPEIRRFTFDCVHTSLLDKATAEAIVDLLEHRKLRVRDYINRTASEYTNISEWPIQAEEVQNGN